MKRILFATMMMLVVLNAVSAKKQTKKATGTEQWMRYELTIDGPTEGNPFTEVTLTADFTNASTGKTVSVCGFYDGEGKYKVRFMPTEVGEWTYTTQSNSPMLNGKNGTVTCIAPSKGNHGYVKASGKHFEYADGSLYYPVGTTAYAWTHMPKAIQSQTLNSLRKAQFNKIRMCVFPKHYALCKELPELYPYAVLSNEHKQQQSGSADEMKILGEGGSVKTQGSGITFDKQRFDPKFFQHLELMIDSLDMMGCEADIILFHPYDKGFWGFDEMTMQENLLYLQYVQARLSSFKNVWWSLSNEYDYVKAKTLDDWVTIIKATQTNDPYGHLCSIHGSTATYFPYEKYGLTHTSIQDEGPVMTQGRASILRNIYNIPVVLDEVRYEGNLWARWGRMSAEEMLFDMWSGLTQGIYVTHGECYQRQPGDFDIIFWAKGGKWRGESWKRIPFMRSILADLPEPLQMSDVSRDEVTSTAGDGYYIIYFGERVQDDWPISLPAKNANYPKAKAGQRFSVEIIDTWNMTITPWEGGTIELGEVNDYRLYDKQQRKIRLPKQPYLMLRLKRLGN